MTCDTNQRTAAEPPEFPESLRVERAEGLHVWLQGENEPYVDLIQGYSTTSWGHRHPDILAAARLALENIDHVSGFTDAVQDRVSARLVKGCGLDAGQVYFDVGGAQIARLALHAAVCATGRLRTACVQRCFHGHGCTGAQLTESFLNPTVPRPDCDYAEVLEAGSDASTARIRQGDLAAVILEPIQGAAGFQELPAPWLTEVAHACRESGTLLVSDEIQVGLGRTGTFAALERTGLRADMYVFSKALGGGLFPVSALVARPGILPHSLTDSEGFGSTFSQNQFGMRIADAVLDLLNRTLATTDIRAKGALLCDRLAPGGRREGCLRVRRYGLAVALDFETPSLASAFRERAFAEHFLFCHVSGAGKNVVRMFPPLNTPEQELNALGERLGGLLATLTR